MQKVTEQALEETLTNRKNTLKDAGGANAGAIVVMNVKTGEILSMASYPSYDPAEWIRWVKARCLELL